MRPPQNAGEDSAREYGVWAMASGFNETPAERGGRHVGDTIRAYV